MTIYGKKVKMQEIKRINVSIIIYSLTNLKLVL